MNIGPIQGKRVREVICGQGGGQTWLRRKATMSASPRRTAARSAVFPFRVGLFGSAPACRMFGFAGW